MKKIFMTAMKVVGAMFISVQLLSLFTLIYTHTGVHITNETGATDYKWEPNQYKATMMEGFSFIRMNEDGFNNSYNLRDVDKKVDILLMGSSHVEAANVAADKNMGYLLNKEILPHYNTYNIGVSGNNIYRCVKNLKSAVEYYQPSKYIVIETDRVWLENEEMQKVLDGSFPMTTSHDSGMAYLLQKYVPCILALYREMGNWIAADNYKNNGIVGVPENDDGEYTRVLNNFLDEIVDASYGKQVIIVYHQATFLTENGLLVEETATEKINMFKVACEKRGIKFIDMYDDFYEECKNNHNVPYGFINTEVGTGHLNETGHKLFAKRIGMVIKELENGAE